MPLRFTAITNPQHLARTPRGVLDGCPERSRFSASIFFVEWTSVGEEVPFQMPPIQMVHGTARQECACNSLPARSGIPYRPVVGERHYRPLPTSSTRAPAVTPN